jgi:hypothetical protein
VVCNANFFVTDPKTSFSNQNILLASRRIFFYCQFWKSGKCSYLVPKLALWLVYDLKRNIPCDFCYQNWHCKPQNNQLLYFNFHPMTYFKMKYVFRSLSVMLCWYTNVIWTKYLQVEKSVNFGIALWTIKHWTFV